jgi:hypothetical protein
VSSKGGRSKVGSGFARIPNGLDFQAARKQAHTAAQLLATAAQTHLERRPDRSESALTWKGGNLVSQAINGVTLHLDPALLVIGIRGPKGDFQLELQGISVLRALEGLTIALHKHGVAPKPWDIPDWDLPMGPLRKQGNFAVQPEGVALGQAYQAAAKLLARVVKSPKAGTVLCWPHHFDLACLLTVGTDDEGNLSQSVGVGMSPGDDGIPQPYLYVTPWPAPEGWTPEPLTLGDWNESWVGAVLHARDWPGDTGARDFVEEAVAVCRGVLDSK